MAPASRGFCDPAGSCDPERASKRVCGGDSGAGCVEGASDADSGVDCEGPRVHVPKTKYAIAFGWVFAAVCMVREPSRYLGSAYHGSQLQGGADSAGLDTVEGRLLAALVSAGCIHESHRPLLGKIQLSKSSRTDKGVHAACTYLGGRFELSHLSSDPCVPREAALATRLNELLPSDIRCFQVLRVTRGFCARSMCSKRMYEYVIPECLLRRRYRVAAGDHEAKFSALSGFMDAHMSSRERVSCSHSGSSGGDDGGSTDERDVDLVLLQDILREYCGSHDFRNFTPRQKGAENTTQRVIHEIKVERRTVDGIDGDLVSVVLTGQSFLYNQIRKMIGLAYEVYLGTAPRCAVKFALSRWHTVQTAIAPAAGLFLHHPFFDAYNKRCNPPQTPFIDYQDVEPLVEDFKRRQLYPEILRSFDGDAWSSWLSTLCRYPFFLENQGFQVSASASAAVASPAPVAAASADGTVSSASG